jgi:hypothetical protein
VDLDWAEADAGAAVSPNASGATHGAEGFPGGDTARMTDEEILGIEPVGTSANSKNSVIPNEVRNPSLMDDSGNPEARRDSSGRSGPRFTVNAHRERNDGVQESAASAEMPGWMVALAADPKTAAEARQLWQEHQAYRASFSSADEARALKELLPGGTQEILALRDAAREVLTLRQSAETLRESAQSVERIDAAIFSGDVRAQSEVVAEMARANPAAFRSMFAEAAKVLANLEAGGRRQEAGNENRRQDAGATNAADHESPALGGNHPSQELRASQSPAFDPAAYASFERTTNDVVARDVRGSISDTLGRVLPEGIADGAAKRIGEDIFNEVHRALAADRALSEQVGEVLRDRRFGSGEQQRVASLLAGRAKQLVPSVARRVIGEWTSSVLGTARSKAARQAAATSRVDIAAAGGSLDSMPLRAMSGREVNYASMSDDEILGM